MRVVISRPAGGKVKTVFGKLISDGPGWLTVLVQGLDGSTSIKRFNKSKVSYHFVDEKLS